MLRSSGIGFTGRRTSAQLRLEFFDGGNAAGANGRMLGIRADVGFPMPAALAFLAIGPFKTNVYLGSVGDDGTFWNAYIKLRNVY